MQVILQLFFEFLWERGWIDPISPIGPIGCDKRMAALLTQRVGDWVAAHAAQFIYAYWAHSPYWPYPLPPWRCVSSAGARAPHPTIYFYIFCGYIFCNYIFCNYICRKFERYGNSLHLWQNCHRQKLHRQRGGNSTFGPKFHLYHQHHHHLPKTMGQKFARQQGFVHCGEPR